MKWKEDMNDLIDNIEEGSSWHDFHSDITIQFGELIESGFDWGKNEYFTDESFTANNRTRLNQKIQDHFYYREICEVPPGKFKLFLVRKLNEIMPKYNELYKLIDNEYFKVLRTQTGNDRSRNVFSEYPQSQLNGENDYATNANDNSHASTVDGPVIDMMIDYQKRYNDVDVMILNELDVCFLSMFTTSVNGF